MPKNIYCGASAVPKGKVRGTMLQCAESGQVRYYGLKLVDKRILSHAQHDTVDKITDKRNQKMIKLMGMRGELKKMHQEYRSENDLFYRKKLKQLFLVQKDKVKKAETEFLALDKKMNKMADK